MKNLETVLPNHHAATANCSQATPNWWTTPLAFVLLIVLSACQLVAPYDEITDQKVAELTSSTEKILAKADAEKLDLKESNVFLLESLGEVRALRLRAEAKPKNKEESDILKGLEERIIALQSLNRPVRRSLATGLRATLLDLQQVQIAKKRGAKFEASLKKNS